MPPKKNKPKVKSVATKAKSKAPPKRLSTKNVGSQKQKSKSKETSLAERIDQPSTSRGGDLESAANSKSKGNKPEDSGHGRKKGVFSFGIKRLSAKQYAKWKPMRKETEEFLKRISETNTNLLLNAMPSSDDYERCRELLNGVVSSYMESLLEAKIPKPAIINFKRLKEKTTELEDQLSLSKDLYDRMEEALEDYERLVEKREAEKERLENILGNEETPIPLPNDMNPHLQEVLSKSTLPDMISLDNKSSATYFNRSQANSRKKYGEFKHQCESISKCLPEKP